MSDAMANVIAAAEERGRRQEREACARLAEPLAMPVRGTDYANGANDTAMMIYAAIRARSTAE